LKLRPDKKVPRDKSLAIVLNVVLVPRTNLVPLSGLFPVYLTGASNLRSPIGGWANGIPRYSDTPVWFVAAWPETGPLLVCTVCPTVQLEAVPCRAISSAAHIDVAALMLSHSEVLMVDCNRVSTTEEKEEQTATERNLERK
jgi:hypothetical protein